MVIIRCVYTYEYEWEESLGRGKSTLDAIVIEMKIKAKITKEEIRKKEFLRLKKRDASSINRRCRRRWCTISFPLFSYIIIIFLFLFEEEGGGRRVVGSFFRYDPSRDTTGVTFTVSRVAIVASKKNRRREIYCSE